MTIRTAVAADAQAIGAVFDAAVKVGWSYMGELVQEPMFPPDEWDDDVARELLAAGHDALRESDFRGVALREIRMVAPL